MKIKADDIRVDEGKIEDMIFHGLWLLWLDDSLQLVQNAAYIGLLVIM